MDVQRHRALKLCIGLAGALLLTPVLVSGMHAAVAIPSYIRAIRSAKESVLKDDLRLLRAADDAYIASKHAAPRTLDALLNAGLIQSIPIDPMTRSHATWLIQSGDMGVYSGSNKTGSDGRPYNTW